MIIDPHLAALVVSTAAGFLMVFSGLKKSALELRRRRRVCPSCGREFEACKCG